MKNFIPLLVALFCSAACFGQTKDCPVSTRTVSISSDLDGSIFNGVEYVFDDLVKSVQFNESGNRVLVQLKKAIAARMYQPTNILVKSLDSSNVCWINKIKKDVDYMLVDNGDVVFTSNKKSGLLNGQNGELLEKLPFQQITQLDNGQLLGLHSKTFDLTAFDGDGKSELWSYDAHPDYWFKAVDMINDTLGLAYTRKLTLFHPEKGVINTLRGKVVARYTMNPDNVNHVYVSVFGGLIGGAMGGLLVAALMSDAAQSEFTLTGLHSNMLKGEGGFYLSTRDNDYKLDWLGNIVWEANKEQKYFAKQKLLWFGNELIAVNLGGAMVDGVLFPFGIPGVRVINPENGMVLRERNFAEKEMEAVIYDCDIQGDRLRLLMADGIKYFNLKSWIVESQMTIPEIHKGSFTDILEGYYMQREGIFVEVNKGLDDKLYMYTHNRMFMAVSETMETLERINDEEIWKEVGRINDQVVLSNQRQVIIINEAGEQKALFDLPGSATLSGNQLTVSLGEKVVSVLL